MHQQLVQTAVQGVTVGDAEVLPEQVTQGAMVVPVAVQPPCAAGIDQAVTHQGLEDVEPPGALAAGRQAGAPEVVEAQA